METNTLDFYNIIETIFKENNIMGSKIQLIESIENNKVRYSRKKYVINEIDLQINGVKFWVGNGGTCTTIDVYSMFLYLVIKNKLHKQGVSFYKDLLISELVKCKEGIGNSISRGNALKIISILKFDKEIEIEIAKAI